jgi:hypothetical protein
MLTNWREVSIDFFRSPCFLGALDGGLELALLHHAWVLIFKVTGGWLSSPESGAIYTTYIGAFFLLHVQF